MTGAKTQVFKAESQGDTIYIAAQTREKAAVILRRYCGDIPDALVTWSGPMPLPKGEEALR